MTEQELGNPPSENSKLELLRGGELFSKSLKSIKQFFKMYW